jgi:hypothetical protein
MSNIPNGDNAPIPVDIELVKLIVKTRQLLRLMDTIREIIDTDPIDVPKLEARPREGIGTVKKVRDASAAGPSRDKRFDAQLDWYDGYFKMLLAQIVGVQH